MPEIVDAAAKGDTDRVRDLLEQGVSTDIRDLYDRTALMHGSSHLDVIQLLLDHQADVNAVDNSGKTPLIFAIFRGKLEAAALLLSHGADLHIRDKSGKLPVTYAWEAANYEMLKVLYQAEPGSDIALAALMGDLDKVKAMHRRGADLNIKSEFGETTLTAAIGRRHFEVAKYLIDAGADVNELGRYCSPLVSAILEQSVPLIENLISHGADINGMTDYGSPLIAAVTSGNLETVKILLHHRANIHAVDSEGHTALSSAVCDEHQDIVDLLLLSGAALSQ